MNNIFQSFILALALFVISLNTYAFTTTPAMRGSSNEVLKLIYVGTNETLSEALYHLDLQNGKLDEPHIVVSIRKSDKPKVLKFIDINNRAVKQHEFGRQFDLDIYDNKYVMATEKLVSPGENYINAFNNYFYDQKGTMLWERPNNYYTYFVSVPNNMIVEIFNYGDRQFALTAEVNVLDLKGEKKYAMYFPKAVNGTTNNLWEVEFGDRGRYALYFEEGDRPHVRYSVYAFDKTGKMIYQRRATTEKVKLILSDLASYSLERNAPFRLYIYDKDGSSTARIENVRYYSFEPRQGAVLIKRNGDVSIGRSYDPSSMKFIKNCELKDRYSQFQCLYVGKDYAVINTQYTAPKYDFINNPKLIDDLFSINESGLRGIHKFVYNDNVEEADARSINGNISLMKHHSNEWQEYVSFDKDAKYDWVEIYDAESN